MRDIYTKGEKRERERERDERDGGKSKEVRERDVPLQSLSRRSWYFEVHHHTDIDPK